MISARSKRQRILLLVFILKWRKEWLLCAAHLILLLWDQMFRLLRRTDSVCVFWGENRFYWIWLIHFFSTSLDFSCIMWLEAMGKVCSNITGVFSWPGTDGFSLEKSKNDQSQKVIKRNFQPKTVPNFTCLVPTACRDQEYLCQERKTMGRCTMRFIVLWIGVTKCHRLSWLGFPFVVRVSETLCDIYTK